jgi:hypothetical protein
MNTLFEILVYTWAYIILGLYCKEAMDHIHEVTHFPNPWVEVVALFIAPPALIYTLFLWLGKTTVRIIKRLIQPK